MSLLRQLNRQISKHGSWPDLPDPIRVNLQQEWQCIRKAQGYGASWEHWILGFEAIPFVPCQVPSIPLLHNMTQLTRYDAEIAFRQEEKQRRFAHRHLIQIDQKEKHGSLISKAMRDPDHKVITGMPCMITAEARLLRLSKGINRLLLCNDQVFQTGAAFYGDISIKILKQDRRFLEIARPQHCLPTQGQAAQSRYTQDITKMSKDFFNFWAPMWMRDSDQEASWDSPWEGVLVTRDHPGHGTNTRNSGDMG